MEKFTQLKMKRLISHSPEMDKAIEIIAAEIHDSPPKFILIKKAKKYYIEFFTFYDSDNLIGAAYNAIEGDFVNIMLLAVEKNEQSKGYGSKILSLMKERYLDKRIALGIEEPVGTDTSNEQKEKRKRFYIDKNGFEFSGTKMLLNKIQYDVLTFNGDYKLKDMKRTYKKFLGFVGSLIVRPKFFIAEEQPK